MLKIIEGNDHSVMTLEELKAHLRIEHDFENDYLRNLVQAATVTIENYLQQSIFLKTFEYTSERSDCNRGVRYVALPMGPVQEILSIETNSAEKRAIRRFSQTRGGIEVSIGNHVSLCVRYRGGFALSHSDVPEPIRLAVMLIAGELYEKKSMGALQIEDYALLLAPYRRMSI